MRHFNLKIPQNTFFGPRGPAERLQHSSDPCSWIYMLRWEGIGKWEDNQRKRERKWDKKNGRAWVFHTSRCQWIGLKVFLWIPFSNACYAMYGFFSCIKRFPKSFLFWVYTWHVSYHRHGWIIHDKLPWVTFFYPPHTPSRSYLHWVTFIYPSHTQGRSLPLITPIYPAWHLSTSVTYPLFLVCRSLGKKRKGKSGEQGSNSVPTVQIMDTPLLCYHWLISSFPKPAPVQSPSNQS